MSEICETYERNGLDVNIFYDTDPESPREWDNFGVMICSHRNYTLGDEQFNADDYDGWDDLAKHLREEQKAVIILPLGLYDHSGITMYVGDSHDRWDGGQVGFIYCTREQVDNEFDGDMERAEQCLRGEVKTYDQYLVGDVYGFTIVNPKDGEEIDSCWGFYGLEAVKEEADSMADYFKHPHDAAYAKNASVMHG